MGGVFGGGKPDTSAAEAQLAAQRAETARMRKEAEEEKRDMQEQMAAKRRATSRGGKRMLLSDTRLNPEIGLEDEQTKLGG
jgi:hypothetical protein